MVALFLMSGSVKSYIDIHRTKEVQHGEMLE